MTDSELLRSFLAVYRAGSVTEAAVHRGISQPAVSQQLAALERIAGARLFIRGPGGVTPTQRGRELYARAAGPVEALEQVLGELRGSAEVPPRRPVRLGSSPEYFAAVLLPRLAELDLPVTAAFGNDESLLALLDHGELDLAVTSTTPARRSMRATPIGARRFSLAAAPGALPPGPLGSVPELADWLMTQPWVSYSLELPITRRFWQSVLGRPFTMRPRLVAPDLRAVLRAVELGIGVSLLPAFVCAEPLAEGRIAEPYPVTDLIPEEPWFACTRPGEPQPAGVSTLLAALTGRE
ncbi:MAG: LysR family transcriptional regulator [Actinomycetota bacterium]|jgi:DNA-binding transcriptional LysR family regulator|nr:LysR family transcriptional regulator [Actinomycetota bacterium]